jgi:hypothetical protein
MSLAVDRLLHIYRCVLSSHLADRESAPEAKLIAASDYLRALTPDLKTRTETESRAHWSAIRAQQAEARIGVLEVEADQASTKAEQAESRATAVQAEAETRLSELRQLETRVSDLEALLAVQLRQLERFHASRAWNAVRRLRKLRTVLFGPDRVAGSCAPDHDEPVANSDLGRDI